jgi:hypothetical protein
MSLQRQAECSPCGLGEVVLIACVRGGLGAWQPIDFLDVNGRSFRGWGRRDATLRINSAPIPVKERLH